MSQRSLTGYDNIDASSGKPDEEVYLYDAASHQVTCASCNPSGSQPAGVYDNGELIGERQGNWKGQWLAGSIPGWSGVSTVNAFHQPRYLSNSGRLFFDSPEAYVPEDTNGVEDVYEYEPYSVGGCGSGSGYEGVTAYEGRGCLALVSGGTGPEESGFVDASETGNDVFFVTSQSLVRADRDANFDMYDAHVCSTEAPCPPAPAETGAPCTTGETCREGAATLPVFGPPSSATVSGAGNLTPGPMSKPAVKPKAKGLTRTKKLAKALKACKRDKLKARRSICEKRARRDYGRSK